MTIENKSITRRRFLHYAGTFSIMAGFAGIAPAYALQQTGIQAGNRQETIPDINLLIRWDRIDVGGREGRAITLNGSIPGPMLRLKEGKDAVIHVTNELEEDTSIHWHGILLPAEMDGVPGVSFPGIKPGQTFTYRYPVKQSGTYWYHSHSGVQEQSGHYGPLIIDPAEPEPFEYDREYVVMLSDWTFEDPKKVFLKLKKMSDYYNFQRRTVGDFFSDISEKGFGPTMSDRLAWGRMRMSPTDIADVTGYTYTYLMNGLSPRANWTGLFKPGERIRLRFINGSAMSYFNIRIPGLKLSVIQSDGQNIKPVEVEEFQIAVAETYDVIVNPGQDSAYTIFAESMDRSGYALGTLATQPGMAAPIPALREHPLRTMIDMGMPMEKMDNMKGMEMNNNGAESSQNSHHHHGSMNMEAGEIVARHGPDHHGPGNTSIAMVERNRLGEPGTGLEDVGHRVLVYTDLKSLDTKYTKRKPDREIELHLTGNMEHYMWSFDGKKFSEVKGPIPFKYGERVRLTMVNDTMMEHPIHLHGMWMVLDNGNGAHNPRKHTISVKPAERLSVEIDADAPGNWAFHCHLLYHMEAGMFRVVNVSADNETITRK
jgi:CopA family copper-resistance protein